MTLHDEHGDLPHHAGVLMARLETLREALAPYRVEHFHHLKYVERARRLGDHLRAAMLLSSSNHYASGFVTLRAALEHHLIDRLLFLADRWVESYRVRKPRVAAEEARLAALQATRPWITRWWWDERTGQMHVVIRGLFTAESPGSGTTLSPYYFRVDQYDPFTGRAEAHRYLADPFPDEDARRQWAQQSRQEWFDMFRLDRLRLNLVENRLLTTRQAVQLDVHYAFLSAFVHGAQRAYDLLYGRNIPNELGRYDHYSSELVLLYVITLATEELTAFRRMARRVPTVRMREWELVGEEIDRARSASEYLWFLSGQPQMYDRIEEVHTRVNRRNWQTARRVDPPRVPASRVRYYTNPLTRLIALHSDSRELITGLAFRSPFPRQDARFRC